MFTKSIGIDLGTTNTLVYIKNRGIVLREPSVVAVDIRNNTVVAVGNRAKDMVGRTPDNINVVKPLKDGVISDFDITAIMIKYFIKKATKNNIFFKPKIVICIPSGVTTVEKRAVEDASKQAGAGEVKLIVEPMAAAMGANLPVTKAQGSMVVDIGGGTSEMAVISQGGIVTDNSIRVAGNRFDDSIIQYIKKKYGLLIGETTAEKIKISIGSAYPYENENDIEIKGKNLSDGLPRNIIITSEEVRKALKPSIELIIEAIKGTLEATPPEISADIIDYGITLTGGGALLRGLDTLIGEATNMPVHMANKPLDCVVEGTGRVL